MSIQKQRLYNIIENLPDELSIKVIDYIEYLKFVYTTNSSPKDLIINSNNDLVEKIGKGIKDTDDGKVCTIDEAFIEIDEILAK